MGCPLKRLGLCETQRKSYCGWLLFDLPHSLICFVPHHAAEVRRCPEEMLLSVGISSVRRWELTALTKRWKCLKFGLCLWEVPRGGGIFQWGKRRVVCTTCEMNYYRELIKTHADTWVYIYIFIPTHMHTPAYTNLFALRGLGMHLGAAGETFTH